MPYHFHPHKKTTEHSGHIPAMIAGFNQMFRTPVTSFFIIFIITFALFLPAGFYVLKKNINALDNAWNQSAEIALYLKKSIDPKTVTDLVEKLKLNDAIEELKLIPPEDGLKHFAQNAGFVEMLLGVDNPLPNVIIIQPKLIQLSEARIIALIDDLKSLPEVETTQTDMNWVGRSYKLLNLLEQISAILVFLFDIGAVVIICFVSYFTPQIIMNKINTSKRVLQYQCFWHSLIGSLLALALINFILMVLHNAGFVLQGLGTKYSVILILLGAFFGIVSSKFAMKKHN
ncbi:MAG: cell division protein FtsX [uncultured bacterium]|nr:MAG: cell division protein FtsX [uncultured bacterium]